MKGKSNKPKYTKLELLAKTLIENIRNEYSSSGLSKNTLCGKIPIVNYILSFCKQTVLSECLPMYHSHHMHGIVRT